VTDQLISSIVTVIMAIIGIALIAVLVSRQSNTTGVLTAGGSALSGILGTAISPVTRGGSVLGGASFTGGLGGISIGF
jgi:hypothetical protein